MGAQGAQHLKTAISGPGSEPKIYQWLIGQAWCLNGELYITLSLLSHRLCVA